MSKYLKTKEGSIESAVLKSVNTPKEEPKKVNVEFKPSSYFGVKEGTVSDAASKAINEKVDNAYAIGMSQAMKKTGDNPPLKKSTITKAHDIAKAIKKDEVKEESINEAEITLHDHDSTNKDFKDLVRKSNLTMKVKRGYKGDDVTLSGNPMNIERMLKLCMETTGVKLIKEEVTNTLKQNTKLKKMNIRNYLKKN